MTDTPQTPEKKITPPSPEEIAERLRQQREALASSVDALAARVDPRTQARLAGEQLWHQAQDQAQEARATLQGHLGVLHERLEELREEARSVVDQAKAGDSNAIAKVAAVAGGTVAAAVVLGRLIHR